MQQTAEIAGCGVIVWPLGSTEWGWSIEGCAAGRHLYGDVGGGIMLEGFVRMLIEGRGGELSPAVAEWGADNSDALQAWLG